MKIIETLQTKSKEDAKKAISEQLSMRALDVLNEIKIEEALMSPQQKMDFDRYMHGAMSKKEYREKWKVGQKTDGKYKLDPTGLYHNMIKTAGEEDKKTSKE